MRTLSQRQFPRTRLRRLRRTSWLRELTQESCLSVNDLIAPVFISDAKDEVQPINAMPNIYRYNLDSMLNEIDELYQLGIKCVALFPQIDVDKKSLSGAEALNQNGLIPNALLNIKKRFPQMGVIVDIALDPYTVHGHDGVVDEAGSVLNDQTSEILAKQAILYAQCGADVLAPSDMMDGRIGRIRNALEEEQLQDVTLLSYSAKYASSYYGPFREAVGSVVDGKGVEKTGYQMNPNNAEEALHEVALDLQEGADIVMVKPAGAYLDVIRLVKDAFQVPVFAYQVSGEYAMLQAAIEKNWLDDRAIMESLLCIKRSGADAVFTYFAKQIVKEF